MGKSSLMQRTAEELHAQGIIPVIIDLSQMGSQLTAEQWYLGILTIIVDNLDLDVDLENWWHQHQHMGMVQRLTQFFQKILLTEVSERMVIFIDEIDTTLNLPFTDDFFSAIRYLYNARAEFPEFDRFSFVLIGVATPSDLINDPKRTPFNIGQRVDLSDFIFAEALPLANGFDLQDEEAQQVLSWVLKWTDGHPYLTQRLCYFIAVQDENNWSEIKVDQLVAEFFFDEESEKDSNLLFVRDMLTRRAPDTIKALTVYREIRRGRHKVFDEEQSPIKSHLKLSGIVRREQNVLQVRNLIYSVVFDLRWIRQHWPINWIKRTPKRVWLMTASLLIALIISILYALAQQEFVVQQEAATKRESVLRQEAERERRRAEGQAALAEERKTQAIQAAVSETEARQEAQRERQRAEVQARLAIENERKAILSAAIADSLRQIAEERQKELERLNRISSARLLAIQAPLKTLAGEDTLGVLLARQAYLFNQANDGQLHDKIYDALRQSLYCPAFSHAGGPQELPGHQGWVRSVAFNPQGGLLASADEGGTIRLWNWQNEYSTNKILYQARGVGMKAITFSPDGNSLVSASDDHVIRLWSNFTKDQPDVRLLTNHKNIVLSVAFSPDGEKLASADASGLVLLWDLNKVMPICIDSLKFSKPIRSIVFNPVNDYLATGGDEKIVGIWRLQNDRLVPVDTLVLASKVNSLAFSLNGEMLAIGSDNRRVLIWQTNEVYQDPLELLGHRGPVNSVAFRKDGQMLASASADKTIRLWNLEKPESNPFELQMHGQWVWSVAFSPDGNFLASGGADQRMLLWVINIEILANRVCEVVKRNLTWEEWKEYIGEDISYQLTCPDLPPAEGLPVSVQNFRNK
jgi:WD40 repeat protein